MRKTLIVGGVTLVLMLALAPLAMAQLPEPTVPDVCTGPFCGGLTLDTIGAIINRIAQFLITIGIIIAIIFIIWGGIMYMTAGDNDEKAGDAKKRIFNGVIGAAVVLAVGVILQTVARLVTGGFFGIGG